MGDNYNSERTGRYITSRCLRPTVNNVAAVIEGALLVNITADARREIEQRLMDAEPYVIRAVVTLISIYGAYPRLFHRVIEELHALSSSYMCSGPKDSLRAAYGVMQGHGPRTLSKINPYYLAEAYGSRAAMARAVKEIACD